MTMIFYYRNPYTWKNGLFYWNASLSSLPILWHSTRSSWALNSNRDRIDRAANILPFDYDDVTMGAMAFQITSLTTVCSTVYSDADQRKHQSSASLAFVWGFHRGRMNSPYKWPVTRKMSPFDDVIMWKYFFDKENRTIGARPLLNQCRLMVNYWAHPS